MILALAALLLAMIATALLTPLVLRLGWRLNVVDLPGTRKIHSDPVPRLGGIAIFGGFLLALAIGGVLAGHEFSLFGQLEYHWLGYFVGAVLIVLCGTADDVRGLRAPSKFAVQFLAAGICYYSGFKMTILANPFDGDLQLGWLSLPFTLLWVVGVTNAVNMIDGLDGLAGGVSLIIIATVGMIAFARDQFAVTVLSAALAGSLLGFLRYNLHPARIFMGDSGSMFLGFSLAVMAMRGSQKSATAIAIGVPLLVLGLPVLDTLLVMARRAWIAKGAERREGLLSLLSQARRIFMADREHIHHNLMELGVSHRRTVWILYLICMLFALTAYSLAVLANVAIASALTVLSVGSVVAIKGLVMVRRRGSGGPDGGEAAGSLPPGGGPGASAERPAVLALPNKS